MKPRSKVELKALEAAYDICFLMEDHCANVLASGEKDPEDIKLRKQASRYIKWYQKEVLSN